MNRFAAVGLLFLAAVLEAIGDALVRRGLHTPAPWTRAILFAAGALALFAYSYAVNSPPWTFGRLLGLYVVFFFVLAQLVGWLVFHEQPTRSILVGGAFIVCGGVILTAW